ncbi:hypothetical protein Q3G72_022282 [Acer saccharum]|nr:hypothetical protein Q3G72_022282 [Acer saccharum]
MPWSNESRQSRGYGAEWEKIRKLAIKRAKGMCEECARQGRVAMGKDVDHKVPKAQAEKLGWTQARIDGLANLQYLCRPCHEEKTSKENGRAYRPKVQIGLDGWPIENS